MNTEIKMNESISTKVELSELFRRKSLLESRINVLQGGAKSNQHSHEHSCFMESQFDISPISIVKAFGSFLIDQFSFKKLM